MRRLLTLVIIAAMICLAAPATASAHDLSCNEARARAHHAKASCYKTSKNHAWLYFNHRTCREHVYWKHEGGIFGDHFGKVIHCAGWHS